MNNTAEKPANHYRIWKHESGRNKKDTISDWGNDSQSCMCTNIDESDYFFVPKKSKLLKIPWGSI